MITLYGIKNCGSVKKARQWLELHGFDYQFHDFRVDGIDKTLVNSWLKELSWPELLNKRSTSWKQLTEQQRLSIEQCDSSAANCEPLVAILLETPTLIKRPVLENDAGLLLVGFKTENYTTALM